jgi:tRNA modification GTPase
LTARGRGAIAVIRVRGARAIQVADAVFRPERGVRLVETSPGRMRLGRIGEGSGDQVVATLVEGEQPDVEIQCHGGPAAVALVLDALEAAGATRGREPGRPDDESGCGVLVDEALVDLAEASTLRTAEILLDQVHGALGREVARVVQAIDTDLAAAVRDLEVLIERAAFGTRLLPGWTIAIAGRPNVGKSRLLNALAGFPRAIVDSAPGTTRDVVRVRTSFDGWPVEIADTAGLRGTDDVVEGLGIDRARREHERAQLVLLVLDQSEPLLALDRQMIKTGTSALLVANKADLLPAWLPGEENLDDSTIVTVSAERGDGIASLIAAIVGRLVPDPPPPGAGVPFRAKHLNVLLRAQSSLMALDRATASASLHSMIGGGRWEIT